jgi:hypothetical protein
MNLPVSKSWAATVPLPGELPFRQTADEQIVAEA